MPTVGLDNYLNCIADTNFAGLFAVPACTEILIRFFNNCAENRLALGFFDSMYLIVAAVTRVNFPLSINVPGDEAFFIGLVTSVELKLLSWLNLLLRYLAPAASGCSTMFDVASIVPASGTLCEGQLVLFQRCVLLGVSGFENSMDNAAMFAR